MLKQLINLIFLSFLLAVIIFLQHNPFNTSPDLNSIHSLAQKIHKIKSGPKNNVPFLIDHGPRNKREIALTFDADMTEDMKNELLTGRVSSWYNEKLIKELEQTKTSATLFMTGLWVQLYPSQAKQLAKNPLFEIGNHTWDHPSLGGFCFGLPEVAADQYVSEIENAENEIQTVTGVKPKLFRFPGGCANPESLQTVKQLGMQVVSWDDVGGDSYLKSAADIENAILSQVKNGSIIVLHMHDPNQIIAGDTADAIVPVIEKLRKEGYKFVTVSQLLGQNQQKQISYLESKEQYLNNLYNPISPSPTVLSYFSSKPNSSLSGE